MESTSPTGGNACSVFDKERIRAEQFKNNFLLLKSQLSRKDEEVQRLQIEKDKGEKETRDLVKKLKADVILKDAFILQLTQKLETVLEDNLLASQIQENFERRCNSKLAVTQNALEETQNALRHLHLQTDSLLKVVAETQEKSFVEKKIFIAGSEAKKTSLEREKLQLTKQLKIVRSSWSLKREQWRKELAQLRTGYTNLQKETDAAYEDKARLTTQLETLRLTHSQQEHEWKSQYQRLEIEHGDIRRQLESVLVNYRSAQDHANELESQVRNLLKELTLVKGQLEDAIGQHRRENDALVLNHTQEISNIQTDKANLNQLCQELQRKLESEVQSSHQISSKLLIREKELAIGIERYQMAEMDFLRQLDHERRETDTKLEDSKRELVSYTRKVGGFEERLRIATEQFDKTKRECESVKIMFESVNKECAKLRTENAQYSSDTFNVEKLTNQIREMEERSRKEHAESVLLTVKNQQYAKLIWKLRKRLQEVALQETFLPPSQGAEISGTNHKEQN